MKYLIGIDVGTHSLRACLFDMNGHKASEASVGYRTDMPRDGWVEQEPLDWWNAAVTALRRVVAECAVDPADIVAISYACTSCTVVVLDENGKSLRPAIMWMDERAYQEAWELTATHHPQLKYGGSEASPQWMIPKGLWLSRHEPDVFDRAYRIVEQTDYFTYRLSGEWSISQNNATSKWCYVSLNGGWSRDLIEKVSAEELVSKWPERVLQVGTPVGHIREDVAREVGLSPDTLIVQGGIDAHGGMVGLSGMGNGDVSMVLGTSTCLMAQSNTPVFANVWGPFPDSLMKGTFTIGGGQSTTGAILDWLVSMIAGETHGSVSDIYQRLDAEASRIPPGSDGLVALDYFQGNRNPYKDPQARGALWGLTLRHTVPHIYRAFCEAVAYGVRLILDDLLEHGFSPTRILAGGGGAKSPLWMQIHADCIGMPIRLAQEPENTALGAAIWAGLGAGVFRSYQDAIESMVTLGDTIEPNPDVKPVYDFYYSRYVETYHALKESMHSVVSFEEKGQCSGGSGGREGLCHC